MTDEMVPVPDDAMPDSSTTDRSTPVAPSGTPQAKGAESDTGEMRTREYGYRVRPTRSRWCWCVTVTHGCTAFGEFGGWHTYGTRDRAERKAQRFILRRIAEDERRAALSVERPCFGRSPEHKEAFRG